MTRTIYAHHLPPESDPEVRELAAQWIADARAAQRPRRALAYAIPSTLVGVVLWGELNRWTELSLPWPLMAASTLILGILLGRPCRKLGALFDRRWAVLAFVLGVTMAVLGDIYAATALAAARAGVPWLTALPELLTHQLVPWLTHRTPLDWLVAGIAGIAAAYAARPPYDERQLVMEARIEITRRRQEAAEPQAA